MSFIEEWYANMPIVTKAYMTAAVCTTLAIHLELVNLLLLYLNFGLVYDRLELWRLFTNFLFFGHFGLSFFFHMLFMVRHSTMLEESSYRGKSSGMAWLYLVCGGLLLLVDWLCWLAPVPALAASTPMFLGPSLAMSVVYVWARRNPNMRMNLLGFLNFNAPWLPWVIIGLESLVSQHVNWFDIVGVGVGHVYYFLHDVYPALSDRHLLATPKLLEALLDAPVPHAAAAHVDNDDRAH